MRIQTDLPLGEPQLRLASSLSLQSFVFFERSSHNAGCDGEVAVVAGAGQNSTFMSLGISYVRPDAFHANAIVIVIRV